MRRLISAGASLLLVVLAGCAVPADLVPDASLQDTHWKLTHLGKEPVTMTDRGREPHVVFDGKIAVSATGKTY